MLCAVQGATFESMERLTASDKAGLDIFWLRDESLEESDNLPDPGVLAQEIVVPRVASLGTPSD